MLLGLFFLSTAANVGLILMYNSALAKLQNLQTTAFAVHMVQNLYNESVEYSRTHPDIAPYLKPSASAKPAAPNASGTRPQTNK